MRFPENFVWGAAAAAYQIEGAAEVDGKGRSVWDEFCRQPGAIRSGHTGAVACDHYHLYLEDVALMQTLGLQAYRLSVAWPRILPEGTGALNLAGLDFYDRLIDALLRAHITPFITLFHWDYPYALHQRGGWLNADSPQWFAEYTAAVVDRLSDRVQHWMTLNEPQAFVHLGYQQGWHAPGQQFSRAEVLRIVHHVLLAHGLAAQTIRARAKTSPQVGLATVTLTKMPVTATPEDIDAARQAMFAAAPTTPAWNNTWWLDPLCRGQYPADGLKLYGAAGPAIQPGDLDLIHQPLDFLGLNIYHGDWWQAGPQGEPAPVPFPPGHPANSWYWPVTPEALDWGPRFVYERYHLPLYITENGMCNTDQVALDGRVHDPQRIDFTTRYLRELRRAIQAGVDVRGYFHWSILDNFEWAEGYHQRFGLVHVDYQTQQRRPKDSADWYRTVIAANGANV